jgi:predicted RND superfamily exporter protein
MAEQMVDKTSTKAGDEIGGLSRHERIVSILALILILALASGAVRWMTRLESNYSISQFFPPQHPLLEVDTDIRRQFFLDQNPPLLVILDLDVNASSDWLATQRLQTLARASEELRKVEGIKSVLSLGVVSVASQGSENLEVGSLLSIANETERRMRVANDRLLSPTLVSENVRRTVMAVSLNADLSVERMREIGKEVKAQLSANFQDSKIEIGGVPAIQSHFSELLKSEMVRFMGLALLACALVLWTVFSSRSSLLIPLVAIVLANTLVLGFMAIAGFSMTVLAVTIPILISVTVLSLCIHTSLRFAEEASHSAGKMPLRIPAFGELSRKASLILRTLRAIFLPNLLTSLTNCFGFATLLVTDVPVIRDFGIAVAISDMISWLTATVLMVPLMMLMPLPRVRPWVSREAGWTSFVFTRRRSIIATVAIGCVALALIGQNLHWTARLFDDLPLKQEARRATEAIDQALGGTIPYEIVVKREGVQEPWNDPGALSILDNLISQMRVIPNVGSAVGLPDLMRFALGGGAVKLPKSRSAVAENWFLISMAEDSPLKKYLTADGSTMRIGLRLRDAAGNRLEEVMQRLAHMTQAVFPDAKVSTAGMATTVHRLNNNLSTSLMQGFWHALAAISILLLLVFRSWRWTVLAVLPNLVPAAVLIGVLSLAKTPIKPGVALVFSIALGIAFNNTVYLLQRLRSLMKNSGSGPVKEIERTLRLEGNPCLVASVCLLAGFGIFLVSEFGINQTFGAYMLISLFFGLIGDLAFLPALIRTFPWILPSEAGLELASTGVSSGANLKLVASTEAPDFSGDQMTQKRSKESGMRNERRRTAASVVSTLLTISLSALPVGATEVKVDANTILSKVEKGLLTKDESAMIKMKVIESNGSAKEREVEIKRKSGEKSQVLVRIRAPSDVSGVALLSVAQGSKEDQWLYMPSQRKARRVVSGNKGQRFLDTEFNLEDFSASTYARFANTLVKEDRQPSAAVAVIESKTKGADTDSSYSKIMTWVDLATYQIQKSEYYDKEGKLLKTMVFRDYKKFGSAWRAQTVEVRNMQTSRSTILKIAGLKVNSGLNDREFTQSALEQGD